MAAKTEHGKQKVTVIVTEKGHNIPNVWKKGTEIELLPEIAEKMAKKGFVEFKKDKQEKVK